MCLSGCKYFSKQSNEVMLLVYQFFFLDFVNLFCADQCKSFFFLSSELSQILCSPAVHNEHSRTKQKVLLFTTNKQHPCRRKSSVMHEYNFNELSKLTQSRHRKIKSRLKLTRATGRVPSSRAFFLLVPEILELFYAPAGWN